MLLLFLFDNIGYILYNIDGGRYMPAIASFYGIIIMMFLRDKEHEPPHIHAFYGEFKASFEILTGDIMYNGEFPRTGRKLVKKFILQNKDELIKMWNTGIYFSLPPVR